VAGLRSDRRDGLLAARRAGHRDHLGAGRAPASMVKGLDRCRGRGETAPLSRIAEAGSERDGRPEHCPTVGGWGPRERRQLDGRSPPRAGRVARSRPTRSSTASWRCRQLPGAAILVVAALAGGSRPCLDTPYTVRAAACRSTVPLATSTPRLSAVQSGGTSSRVEEGRSLTEAQEIHTMVGEGPTVRTEQPRDGGALADPSASRRARGAPSSPDEEITVRERVEPRRRTESSSKPRR